MSESLRIEAEKKNPVAPLDALVARVLTAVRETLRGHPGASAVVRVDGRVYRLWGE